MYHLYIIVVLFMVFNVRVLHSAVSHQAYFYASSGYANLLLDQTTNVYDIISESAGIGYRANVFVSRKSRHFFSFGVSGGFGIIFPILRGSVKTLEYNTFFETQASIAYGVLFGKSRNHQIYFLGASFRPQFFGVFERDNYTQIGESEVKWYNAFYIPLSVGAVLPSYNYIKNNFFVGFSHNINFLVYGHTNINVPEENRILKSMDYQLKLEMGYSFDPVHLYPPTYIEQSYDKLYYSPETKISITSNGNKITVSIFVAVENENSKTISVEMFALKNENNRKLKDNLITSVSDIPVINKTAQYTRHWKYRKNLSGEVMKTKPEYIYIVYKEIGLDKEVLIEKTIIENIKEHTK